MNNASRIVQNIRRGPPISHLGPVLIEGSKERWFKLHGNLLFYFKTNDVGYQLEGEALGLLVLENYSVQPEKESVRPCCFSICFAGEGTKKHFFAAPNAQEYKEWMSLLGKASFADLKARIGILQGKIIRKTMKDPLIQIEARLAPPLRTPQRVAPPPPPAGVRSHILPPPLRPPVMGAAGKMESETKVFKGRKKPAKLLSEQTGKSSFLTWETFD